MKLSYWLSGIALLCAAGINQPSDAGILDRIASFASDKEEIEKDEVEQGEDVLRGDDAAPRPRPSVRSAAYQTLAAPGPSFAPPSSLGTDAPGAPPSYSGEPMPLPPAAEPSYSTPSYSAPPADIAPPQPYPAAPESYPLPPGPEFGAPLSQGVPLFDRIKVKDLKHIHPCAVPVIVKVLDPCDQPRDCLSCGPRFVFVEVMMPPGKPDIKVRKRGRKTKYEFADYQVEVESKDGYVEVDYDD